MILMFARKKFSEYFFRGLRNLFAPIPRKDRRIRRMKDTDIEAILDDWSVVGSEIEKAIKYHRQSKFRIKE